MTVSIIIPELEPEQVTAGDTWVWKRLLNDYLPSNGWVLSYALVKDGALIQITAADSDDEHYVEIAATITASYEAGIYHWQSYVTNASTSERYKVSTGTIEVLPDFSQQASGYDNRSHVKKTLDALEAVILGKASSDQLALTIGGRSLSKMPPRHLIEWRDIYRAEYAAEERKAGRRQRSLIRARFK